MFAQPSPVVEIDLISFLIIALSIIILKHLLLIKNTITAKITVMVSEILSEIVI